MKQKYPELSYLFLTGFHIEYKKKAINGDYNLFIHEASEKELYGVLHSRSIFAHLNS